MIYVTLQTQSLKIRLMKENYILRFLLAMGVKTGVGKRLPLILAEEATITQLYVIDLIA